MPVLGTEHPTIEKLHLAERRTTSPCRADRPRTAHRETTQLTGQHEICLLFRRYATNPGQTTSNDHPPVKGRELGSRGVLVLRWEQSPARGSPKIRSLGPKAPTCQAELKLPLSYPHQNLCQANRRHFQAGLTITSYIASLTLASGILSSWQIMGAGPQFRYIWHILTPLPAAPVPING